MEGLHSSVLCAANEPSNHLLLLVYHLHLQLASEGYLDLCPRLMNRGFCAEISLRFMKW